MKTLTPQILNFYIGSGIQVVTGDRALRFFTGKQKAMLRQVQREENREIREALKRIERLLETRKT